MSDWDAEKDFDAILYSDENPSHEHRECGVELDVDTFRAHAPHYCPVCERVGTFHKLDRKI